MNRLARPAALVGMALAAVGMILSPAAIAQNLNGDTNVQTPGVVEQTKTFEKTVKTSTTSGSAAKLSCPKRNRKLSFRPIKMHHKKLAARTISKPVLIKKSSSFTKTTTSTKTINLPATVQAAPAPLPAPACAQPEPVCSPVMVERSVLQPVLVQKWEDLPVTMVRREITSPTIIEEKFRNQCLESPAVVAPTCATPCATPCAREFTTPVVIEDRFRRASSLLAPVMVEDQSAAAPVAVEQCAPVLIQNQCSQVMIKKRRHHFLGIL